MTKYKCFLCDSVQGKAYHTISTKPSMKSIWMRICNLEPWEKVSMIRICSDHFRPEDYAGLDPHTHPSDSKGFRYRLKKNAVPSLNLLESTPLLPRYVTNTEVTPAQLGIPVIFEDNTDNVKGEMDDSKLESDEDDKPLKKIIEEVAVKKEDPGNYSEDPLDTAGCGEVKIEDELDIKDEDFEIETDEEEPDEDDSEDEAGFDIPIQENYIQEGEPSTKCNGTTGFSVYPGKKIRGPQDQQKTFYSCKFCSEFFFHKSRLIRHERNHTGEKLFRCKICSRHFSKRWNMLVHQRLVHQMPYPGKKPFQCKICSQSFTVKSYLNKHERIHTGESHPHQCKICSKSFSNKYLLKVHEWIHTGEKPFVCKLCPKSYVSKGNLKHHEKKH